MKLSLLPVTTRRSLMSQEIKKEILSLQRSTKNCFVSKCFGDQRCQGAIYKLVWSFLGYFDSVSTSCCSSSDPTIFNRGIWRQGCVLTLPFPRRASSSVHVRLYMVQHVGQCVLNDGSPAHVTHLTGKTHTHRFKTKSWDIWESESSLHQLTGWYFRSFGGCLKCGPKLTDT